MNKNAIIGGLIFLIILAGAGFFLINGEGAEPDTTTQQESSEQLVDQTESDQSPANNDESSDTSQVNEDTGEETQADQVLDIAMRNYEFSTDEIIASPGETVTINLTTENGMHDFVVDELDVDSGVLSAGDSGSVTFTIPEDAAGQSYEFYCNVGNHRQLGMVGTINVEG